MVWMILDAANLFAWRLFYYHRTSYGIVGTAESRIKLLRFPNLLRQSCIHELRYRGHLVIYKYGKSEYRNSRIPTFYAAHNVKNYEILVCLSMQVLAASRITRTQRKLENCRI